MILKNKIYFIIGTGTDVGKTFLLEKICLTLQKNGMAFNAIKPVISGFESDDLHSDSAKILQIMGKDVTDDNFNAISPWRFKEPLSPNFAAQKEGRDINFAQVVDYCREEIAKAEKLDQFLFIEAAGGVMTPITDDKTFLDLITQLNASILLLSSSYLGTISHSLCAIESLKFRGILPEMVVMNDYPDFVDSSLLTSTINHLGKVKTLPIGVFLEGLQS